MYICTPKNAEAMKSTIFTLALTAMIATTALSQAQAQEADRAAIERELAITAYNYAVGCAEQQKYDDALEGLSHIPAGRLTAQQSAWADSLRMQCEAMVGHPMAAYEVAMAQSEQIEIDDQSETFLRGIRHYQAGDYSRAIECFNEVTEMGQGPRPQVAIEAMFWRGQCYYQQSNWEQCCQELIAFNDAKSAETCAYCDAYAYYTMGYARMQQKKWHHARLNFERYTNREKDHKLSTWSEGDSRLKECRQLEKNSNSSYSQPLTMVKAEPDTGETLAITSALQRVYAQKDVEHKANIVAIGQWKDWKAPYIEE